MRRETIHGTDFPSGMPAALEMTRSIDRRTVTDRAAALVVRVGGMGIIASILAILIFIVAEVWPLASGAHVSARSGVQVGEAMLALAVDPYKSMVASLDRDGFVRVRNLDTGELTQERAVAPEGATTLVGGNSDPDGRFLAALDSAGRIEVIPVEWKVDFAAEERVVAARIGAPSVFELPGRRLTLPFAARISSVDDTQTVVAMADDGSLVQFRRAREVNEFTGEAVESVTQSSAVAPPGVDRLLLDDELKNLYGAGAGGRIYRWRTMPRLAAEPEVTQVDGEVTALTLLLGGRALVVGLADGGIQVWFRTTQVGAADRLTLVRKFPPHTAPVRHLVSSRRDKGFVAVDDEGGVGLYHSTSERVLWRGNAGSGAATAVAFAPKADGILLARDRELSRIDVDNPHPDVSLWSLFAPVWYEGYDRPEYVWQSSSGTDDFEPKYSLTPLLIGTLKGTFYALLIAIPLGVFAAMYVSQFMHPTLRNVIKPTVEIMAALPSVVLGFLAGLWLAPRVEEAFPALLLMLAAFPAVVIGSGWLWERLPATWRHRVPTGSEALLFAVTLSLAAAVCLALSEPFEAAAFGGNFRYWLRDTIGLPYDQRNAIIVGLAMGFAVIPIIFAISEDAFSNVPRNLVSGSLALGANRWQTVSRVVLPTASPGIFSAVMIGFGRAVGETMIVLMATGNTPIQDWNPFNGFRTLSANIAVEIPEAPQFGTLYRVLFLAALLLFAVTFAVNTAAELVRQRLRERYARL
jgi:phosphate transport system permease protein